MSAKHSAGAKYDKVIFDMESDIISRKTLIFGLRIL